MTRPIDPELPTLFEKAVDAILQGKRGFRDGAVIYNNYFVAGLAFNVAEILPADLCQTLRLKCGSADYHQAGQKLKTLMKRTACRKSYSLTKGNRCGRFPYRVARQKGKGAGIFSSFLPGMSPKLCLVPMDDSWNILD